MLAPVAVPFKYIATHNGASLKSIAEYSDVAVWNRTTPRRWGAFPTSYVVSKASLFHCKSSVFPVAESAATHTLSALYEIHKYAL